MKKKDIMKTTKKKGINENDDRNENKNSKEKKVSAPCMGLLLHEGGDKRLSFPSLRGLYGTDRVRVIQ